MSLAAEPTVDGLDPLEVAPLGVDRHRGEPGQGAGGVDDPPASVCLSHDEAQRGEDHADREVDPEVQAVQRTADRDDLGASVAPVGLVPSTQVLGRAGRAPDRGDQDEDAPRRVAALSRDLEALAPVGHEGHLDEGEADEVTVRHGREVLQVQVLLPRARDGRPALGDKAALRLVPLRQGHRAPRGEVDEPGQGNEQAGRDFKEHGSLHGCERTTACRGLATWGEHHIVAKECVFVNMDQIKNPYWGDQRELNPYCRYHKPE